MKEVARRESQDVELSRPAAVIEAIQRAASDPTVDVGKMQALLDMAERLQATSARIEFQAALARLQAKLPRITKDGAISVNGVVRSRYAKLENIDRQIKPFLAEEGFAISFDTELVDNKLVVEGRLTHSAGHSEIKKVPLALDTAGSKSATQSVGSTISYGQRYLIKMFFNIVEQDEDTDGVAPLEPITTDQAIQLRDLMRETGANENRLLAWVGAPRVEDIAKADYGRVMAMLQKKKGHQ